MSPLAIFLAGLMVLSSVAAALAQATLPVKIYREGASWRGGVETVIPVPEDGQARFSLVSAYKVGQRPWAEVIVRRDEGRETRYLSRAYDCQRATMRWLGEASEIADISLSVTSPEDLRDRALVPGTAEFSIAAYACGL